ncbi:MAG: hydroxyacid dehydrogenase [Mesorhizobium sp.]|nr:MAG: hydroxyacid dehydrogenase [Mesorhizobium sp.]
MPTKPVLILDPHWRRIDELFSNSDLAELGQKCEIVWGHNESMPRELLEQELSRATVLVSARPALSVDHLKSAKNLRCVIEVAGSFPPTIDYEGCFERGIEVLSCAPGFRRSVAEMTVAMILSGARGIVQEHEAFRRGNEHWLEDNAATDFSLYGQTLGFVGFGSIARECCRLLGPFAPEILAYDPWLPAELIRAHGAEKSDLEAVLGHSRCVVVAAVPTRENRGLIDAAALERMTPGALLVLVSRAHLVDFPALLDAVARGRIRAAIDVFPQEPVLPDDPLRSLSNLILSPHRAAAVKGGRQEIGKMILVDVARILDGHEPESLQRANPRQLGQVVGLGRVGDVENMAAARS